MSERIVNGNKVFLDDVRGRWTVLFTATSIRKQYSDEAAALAAAGETPGTVKETTSAGVVPKQAVDNALTKKSNATEELDKEVQISINQTVASEGSVLNVTVGNEKDGFTSLTAATTKGTANEGPAIAIMGANIKQGNVTKTVSASAKLSSVTGGTKGTTAVLNETIVQASPKGISKALTTTVGLNSTQVQAAISESSPIPSLAAAAVKVEVEEGGPAKKAAVTVQAASVKVSVENGQSFGSVNPFGSIGSSFGNILGQVVANTTGIGSYKNPLLDLSISTSSTVIDRVGDVVKTPNLINGNGTTNLTKSITKSKLENPLVKRLPNTVKPGQRANGYSGITTKLKGFNPGRIDEQKYPDLIYELKLDGQRAGVNEGGSYYIPFMNNAVEIEAEYRAIERPITTLIIRHSRRPMKRRYDAEEAHISWRKYAIKKYGANEVNNNPFEYTFLAHFFITKYAALKLITPLKYELSGFEGGAKLDVIPNSITVWLDGCADPSVPINTEQLHCLFFVIQRFIKVFPGGEVLGFSDVADDKEKYSNVPFFDVRELMTKTFRKPSVTEENKKAVVPAPADLADATPKNVVLPKRTPNTRPNISSVAVTQNRIANPTSSITAQNYTTSQLDALSLIKQRKDAVNIADLSTGSGLTSSLGSVANLSSGTSLSSSLLGTISSSLGGGVLGQLGAGLAGTIVDKIARSDTTANELLNNTQSFKIEQLKLGKVFDSVTGVFK